MKAKITGIAVFSVLVTILFVVSSFMLPDKIGVNIGDQAPELKYKSPKGEMISLSSLKGKIVLVDFWASWCGPCRMENKNVVKAYKKYHDKKFMDAKGFEIYSVSLDKDSAQWVNAIKKDSLIWKNHVSDLKYWNSEAAKIYGIYAIPDNFLLNGDGIIMARSLRGGMLDAELDKILK